MMLTPEQLAELRDYVHKFRIWHLYQLFTHIDAQQARIAEMEQDAARYRAMRCATIAASYGLGHDPVEIEIKRAMKLSSLQGRRGELTAEEIDSAVDAAMQK